MGVANQMGRGQAILKPHFCRCLREAGAAELGMGKVPQPQLFSFNVCLGNEA